MKRDKIEVGAILGLLLGLFVSAYIFNRVANKYCEFDPKKEIYVCPQNPMTRK